MYINIIVVTSLVFLAPSDFNPALSIESLIQMLSSESELNHAIARQLLPYKHPLEVLPKILPYLSSQNPDIKGTTRNILFDLANECEKWGKDVRKECCNILISSFINSNLPTNAKEDILKAMIFAIDENVDLSPLKQFLLTEEWGEKVRCALVECNTPSAKQLLCDSLKDADDTRKINILLGIYQLYNVPCEDDIVNLLSSPNPAVRSTACLVLSNLPSPMYAEKIFNLCISEPENSEFYIQNWDSLLRITEKIIETGGNWDYAIEIYKKIITHSKYQPAIISAIVNIGRYGDDTCGEFLISLINQSSGEIRRTALSGLSSIQNRGVINQALNLCGYLSMEEQMWLLPILVKDNTPETKDIVLNILKTKDGRNKFLNSFWEFPEYGYLNYINDIFDVLTQEDKLKLTQALWKYVSESEDQPSDYLGKAYLYLYKLVPSDEKQYVISALKKYNLPELSPELISDLLKEDVVSLPFPILYELYNTLPENNENRVNVQDALIKCIKEQSSVEPIISAIAGSKYLTNFPHLAGFVTKWNMVGPFPWQYEKGIDANLWVTSFFDKGEEVVYEGEKFSWKIIETEGWGYVNLLKLCEGKNLECSNLCAFGITKIFVPKAIDGFALLGSDDGFGLWINRENFFAKNVDRAMKPDEDKVPISLRQGMNEIAVLITQIKGGWNFCLRLVDTNNAPINFSIEGR